MAQSAEKSREAQVDPAILANVAETRWAKAKCLRVRLSSGHEESYFLKHYNFNKDQPPVEELCRMMARLHSRSVSPNGIWEVFFSRGLRHVLNLRDQRATPDPVLDAMLPELFDRVIPRLLRPLETGGRKIKPCLVHGGLWYGNVSVDDDTGRPIIYDPLGFWGHHEYELGNWRSSRNKLTNYMSTYYKYMEPSKPVEDFDGRNLLYSLRFHTNACTHFPDEEQRVNM
ncbi:hypothetical protein MCOR25_001208 [Pyricularia grisea]|nr:hypothetical protein MCOR25_001208 [Pyricularia grisea]